MMKIRSVLLLAFACLALMLRAEEAPVAITRASGPISVDGDLSDPAWQTAARFDEWVETNVSDNGPPPAKQQGWVTYDDRFFYVAIKMDDPNPSQIRAPFGDHDNVNGSTDDYAGAIIDSRNDSKTAILFLVNPNNIQYDAATDDNTGEDSSPDYFWDSKTRITPTGWQLEIRIPFASLRYKTADVQTWGIILYRNYPRDRRYQMFTHRLPRGSSCFVCNYNKITGLTNLPSGQHLIAAPYVTAGRSDGKFTNDEGADVKWTPNAYTALDATINPDFSQIESDVAAITANERFAIFYPEKRPFFLEDVNLFATPIQAVSTRTITAPRWGLRGTGKFSGDAYTLLVAQDRGGGQVILPGAESSDFADQDFSSTAAIGRVRHDFGATSFLSMLGTTREISGGAHNRVLGPDTVWRINDKYSVTAQLLFSDSITPNRPDLTKQWDGSHLRSHAGFVNLRRNSAKDDLYVEHLDYGDEFRADNGFVPQVGYRSTYEEIGHTFRPKGFFNRFRVYEFVQYQTKQDGSKLYQLMSVGFGADGRHRSFWRLRYANDEVRDDDRMFERNRLYYTLQFAVNRVLSFVTLDGWIGDEVDFSKHRLGRGSNISYTATIRPNDHLEMRVNNGIRWLNVGGGRLFTAQVERLRATYTFNAKSYLRLVVQNQRTNQNRVRFDDQTLDQHSGSLASQLLFAYKLNWQTVLFVGAGDLHEVTVEEGDLFKSARQVFMKLSYAFQR
jgi:Domain of unknown function (DUF5916)